MMLPPSERAPTILHMSTVHPRSDTRIFHRQCRTLAERTSANVVLIVADGLGNDLTAGVEIIDIGRAPLGRFGRLLMGPWRALAVALRLRPQAVHFHDPELMFIALCLKWTGIPVVFDMHENVFHQIKNKPWIPASLRGSVARVYRIVERIILGQFIVVFAEKSYEADYRWIRRAEVVLNLPRREMCMLDYDGRAQDAIGYIGGVTIERGGCTMIDAISRVRKTHPRARFECIGPVSYEVRESTLFRRALSEGWLSAPGRMPGPDGWLRIARCGIGLAILHAKENYTTSYPTKMFEYMALGLAVVVSDFPLYRDIVSGHRCGLVVDPHDPDAVARAICRMLEHPDEAREMGARGRAAVLSHLNWTSEANKLFSVYKSVVPELSVVDHAETVT